MTSDVEVDQDPSRMGVCRLHGRYTGDTFGRCRDCDHWAAQGQDPPLVDGKALRCPTCRQVCEWGVGRCPICDCNLDQYRQTARRVRPYEEHTDAKWAFSSPGWHAWAATPHGAVESYPVAAWVRSTLHVWNIGYRPAPQSRNLDRVDPDRSIETTRVAVTGWGGQAEPTIVDAGRFFAITDRNPGRAAILAAVKAARAAAYTAAVARAQKATA